MFDYYNYVNELSEEKVLAEIEKINRKLFKIKPGNPMFNQLSDMLNMAESAYQDILYKSRIKSEDTVMDIGEMESTVTEQDYTKDELLDVIVTSYTKDLRDR